MTATRKHLQRPPGYAPRGTSLGLVGCIALTLSPFMATLSLIPVLDDGAGVFLGTMVPNLAFCVPLILVMTLGLHGRRLWYVRFLFGWGAAALACYSVGLLLGLAVLFRLVPEAHPELRYTLIVTAIEWLFLTLCAYWVLRMLRLRYWQPWTRPEQWEPGDETPPRWAPPPVFGPPRDR